jgi:hypothetical protein
MREATADGGGDLRDGVRRAPALHVARRQRAARRGRDCDSRKSSSDDQGASEHGLQVDLEVRNCSRSLYLSELGRTQEIMTRRRLR